MEYLKAWVWTQKTLEQKGKPAADPILTKYVEKLLANIQAFLDTGLVERTKDGNFELAKLADMQVQVRESKSEIIIARELLKNSQPFVSTMQLNEYKLERENFLKRNENVEI